MTIIRISERDDDQDELVEVGEVDTETRRIDAPLEITEILTPYEQRNPDALVERFNGPRLFAYRLEQDPAEKAADDEWIPYVGDRGGTGWQRPSDGEVTYDDDPPGQINQEAVETFLDELPESERQNARQELGLEVSQNEFVDQIRDEYDPFAAELANSVTEDSPLKRDFDSGYLKLALKQELNYENPGESYNEVRDAAQNAEGDPLDTVDDPQQLSRVTIEAIQDVFTDTTARQMLSDVADRYDTMQTKDLPGVPLESAAEDAWDDSIPEADEDFTPDSLNEQDAVLFERDDELVNGRIYAYEGVGENGPLYTLADGSTITRDEIQGFCPNEMNAIRLNGYQRAGEGNYLVLEDSDGITYEGVIESVEEFATRGVEAKLQTPSSIKTLQSRNETDGPALLQFDDGTEVDVFERQRTAPERYEELRGDSGLPAEDIGADVVESLEDSRTGRIAWREPGIEDTIRDELGTYFSSETLDRYYQAIDDWKSDSSTGLSGDHSKAFKKALDIESRSRGWDQPTEGHVKVAEVMNEITQAYLYDEYGSTVRVHRGMSDTGYDKLLSTFIQNPDAYQYDLSQLAVNNYSTQKSVGRKFADKTALITTTVEQDQIALANDALSAVKLDSEGEMHVIGDDMTVDAGNIELDKFGCSLAEFPEGIDKLGFDDNADELKELYAGFMPIQQNNFEEIFEPIVERVEDEYPELIEGSNPNEDLQDLVQQIETDAFEIYQVDRGPQTTIDEFSRADENPVIDLTDPADARPATVEEGDDPEGLAEIRWDEYTSEKEQDRAEKDDEDEWVPYVGDRGGTGWQRPSDGEVTYDDDPPGEIDEQAVETFLSELPEDKRREAAEALGVDENPFDGGSGITGGEYGSQTTDGGTAYTESEFGEWNEPGIEPFKQDVIAFEDSDGNTLYGTIVDTTGNWDSPDEYTIETPTGDTYQFEGEDDLLGYVTDPDAEFVPEPVDERLSEDSVIEDPPTVEPVTDTRDLSEGDTIAVIKNDELEPTYAEVTEVTDDGPLAGVNYQAKHGKERGVTNRKPMPPDRQIGKVDPQEARRAEITRDDLTEQDLRERGYEKTAEFESRISDLKDAYIAGDLSRSGYLNRIDVHFQEVLSDVDRNAVASPPQLNADNRSEMNVGESTATIKRMAAVFEEAESTFGIDQIDLGVNSATDDKFPGLFVPEQDIGQPNAIFDTTLSISKAGVDGEHSVDTDGFHAVDSKYSTVFHELGHAAHAHSLDTNFMNPDYETFSTMVRRSFKDPEDPIENQETFVTEQLSEYGDTNVFELIAESSTLKFMGRGDEVTDDVQELFDEFYGPDIEPVKLPDMGSSMLKSLFSRVFDKEITGLTDGQKQMQQDRAAVQHDYMYGFIVDRLNESDSDDPLQLTDIELQSDVLTENNDTEKADEDEWVPYVGPQEGTGWQRPSDDEVTYDDEPPGEINQEAVDEFLDELPADEREQAREALGVDGEPASNVSLTDAFERAETRKGYREAGFKGGNTTGDEMEILNMPDGSTNFAIPAEAYATGGGLQISPATAKMHNRDSPKVIDALGGNACETAIVDSPEGDEYILKEGIEGETVASFRQDGKSVDSTDKQEKALETAAASYFVGNTDLHGGNMMVDEDDNLVIIDHDSGGPPSGFFVDDGDWHDPARPPTPFGGGPVHELVYDKAIDIRQGNVDLPDAISMDMEGYIQQAVDYALEEANLYDYDGLPDELTEDRSADIQSLEQVSEGERVVIQNSLVGEMEGEVKFANYGRGFLAVWDDRGREVIVESPSEIAEVLD